jgi:hypothetical protein
MRRYVCWGRSPARRCRPSCHNAVEDYQRKRFFAVLNAGYAALRADPEAWQEEVAERAAWDVTLLCGLEDN